MNIAIALTIHAERFINKGIATAPTLAELVIKPIAAGTIAVGIRCGVNQIVSGNIGAKAIPIKGKLIN